MEFEHRVSNLNKNNIWDNYKVQWQRELQDASVFEKKKKTSQNAIQIINVNVQLEDCIVKKKKSTWYFEIIHSTSN